jgi:cation-transporting ATPase E
LARSTRCSGPRRRRERKLDRLQLPDKAPAPVVRDGREVEIPPDDLVRGDLLRQRLGDQIVVDGPLLIDVA